VVLPGKVYFQKGSLFLQPAQPVQQAVPEKPFSGSPKRKFNLLLDRNRKELKYEIIN